jgi:hypothetical protein
MELKKIFYILTLVAASILSLSGCKKLIEVPGNTVGQLTTSQVFADSVSAVNAVVGIYASNIWNSSPLSGEITLYPALTSDELTSSSDYAEYINNALVAGTAPLTGGSSAPIWEGSYQNTLIYAANASIEGLNGSPTLTFSLKDQLIGECEVVRALTYFNLANLFGDVPRIVTSNFVVNDKLPRSPVDSIYTLIISDLTDANARLSVTYPSAERARPNKYTAIALLAKVHLYQEKWTAADSLASIIIQSGIYQLETDPANVFLDGSSEAIWQEPGVDDYPGVTYEGDELNPYSPVIIPPLYLTNFLLNAFEPGDQRKLEWTQTDTVNGTTYTYPYKYKNSNGNPNGPAESYMVLRLAEQYLIRAEARVHEANLSGAASDLNLIRSRAALGNISYTSSGDLLQAVQHERQIELFCEWGNRWFDLKRTNTINAILGAEKGAVWPADGHAALYPIPADQIRLNPNLTQNPGY